MACKELGWTEIPTIPVEGLSDAERQALMLADNRFVELGEGDERLLAEQLREICLAEPGFDIEITGFEIGEIDLKIRGLECGTPAEDPADTQLQPAAGPAVSKPGDVWLLDDHRVLCGTTLDTTAIQNLMGGEHAAMVLTDPHYNLPIDGHVSELGKIQHREFAMATGEMSPAASRCSRTARISIRMRWPARRRAGLSFCGSDRHSLIGLALLVAIFGLGIR